MSCGTNTCGCKSNCGPFLAFILLGASVAVIIVALMQDALGLKKALAQQEAAQKAQIEGQQGQQIVAARNYFYAFYSDILALAKTDPDAAAITKKYGIAINQPAAAPASR